MPNWCEGSLKVRGKPENILRFVRECLNIYLDGSDEPMDQNRWLVIRDYENEQVIVFDCDNIPRYSSIYIEGTRRAFILCEAVNDILVDLSHSIEITSFGFKQAWRIEPDQFIPIAREYDLDIRLYGIEQGMGFVQDFEIVDRGKTIIDHSPKYSSYDEYQWNCPLPWMGG